MKGWKIQCQYKIYVEKCNKEYNSVKCEYMKYKIGNKKSSTKLLRQTFQPLKIFEENSCDKQTDR